MADLKEIYEQIDLYKLLDELKPQRKQGGRYYSLVCPNCNNNEAFIYTGGHRISCNRKNNCSYSASLWEYVKQRDKLTDTETFYTLATAAGHKMAEITTEQAERQANKARQRLERKELLEKAFNYMQRQLFEPAGKDTLNYLIDRGYSIEEIKKAGFGHYPNQDELKKYLAADLSPIDGTNQEYFSIFKPAALGTTHRLIIPIFDEWQEPKGLAARTIVPLEELEKPAKYVFNAGIKKDTFFNFDGYSYSKDLVIVEGLIDAVILQAKGLKDIVATGGAAITSEQLDLAIKRAKTKFTLAFDNDTAGITATHKAIEQIEKAGGKVFIASLPQGYKDADELIRNNSNGLQILTEAINNAQTAAKWSAYSLLSKHCLQNKQVITDKERTDILDEAFKMADSFNDHLAPRDFFNILTTAPALELSHITLGLELERYQERKAERDKMALYRQAGYKLQAAIEKNDTGAIKQATKDLKEIEANYKGYKLQPYSLDEFLTDLRNTSEGIATGFYDLDKFITIPQGAITLIAARPSHGKTTFLTNLCLNMVKAETEGAFYFFSYEETKAALSLNIVNILANKAINQEKNKAALKGYLCTGRDLQGYKIPEIDEALDTYKHYTDNGRLSIFDEALDAESLATFITSEKRRNPRLKAVFIDYIQKVKYKGGQVQSRQVELQRISGRLLEAAIETNIPIILAAQFNRDGSGTEPRLDNLRESGDLEQDANLVLSLYNEAVDKAQKEDFAPNSKEQLIKITALKNRNGTVGQTAYLQFTPQTLRMKNQKRE